MLEIKIILCVMTVLSPHFACTSPSEEGGWEVAYRLADEAELSSTTEQKIKEAKWLEGKIRRHRFSKTYLFQTRCDDSSQVDR